ncbi:MAG: DUF2790 domain-containing protein [Pseudomonas sp.]|jgi:ABC-type uncharacterized transport system auxiliary subunit|uniref:DUF2790 domain-containing protein n=1 Tax=Pseudomonas sp. TaxID=306 RepID=UPI003982A4E6
MKLASMVTALLSSLAPSVFAEDANHNHIGIGITPVEYHYGMDVDVQKVLYRTDNSSKAGVVPVIVVYEDSNGEVRKLKHLEWGGRHLSS